MRVKPFALRIFITQSPYERIGPAQPRVAVRLLGDPSMSNGDARLGSWQPAMISAGIAPISVNFSRERAGSAAGGIEG
jgi:hypothetical protein